MAVSYAFAVGNVRAKEGNLLRKQDIEQLLAMKTVAEALSYVRDKGFADADTPLSVTDVLKAEEQKLWEYVASIAPDYSVFRPFIINNDCQNMKAVLKAAASGRSFAELVVSPVTIAVSDIEKAVQNKEFGILPEFLREAAKEAFEALIGMGDPQLCDALLDAAFMKEKLILSADIKLPMLAELVKTTVFYANMKAALRCARAKKSVAFMEKCLVDTEDVSAKRLISAATKGTDEVLTVLEGASRYSGKAAAEAFRSAPCEFEKFVDNLLMKTVMKAKYVAVGAEPLIAYLQAKLAEIQAVRIVINGIATGETSENTREMLRELYG